MAAASYARHCIAILFFASLNLNATTSYNRGTNFACKQTGPCVCVQESGNRIDLTPLENGTNPSFKFLTTSTNRVAYFYHPCTDSPLASNGTTPCSAGCSLCFFEAANKSDKPLDVQTVLAARIPGTFYNLGHAAHAVFQASETDIHVVYKTENSSATIDLVCDPYGSDPVLSVKEANAVADVKNHALVLTSRHACYEIHYMSGAAIFFLILLILGLVYFVGGMLVLKFIKGATGTEMIPNYEFWVTVPRRLKSGCLQLFGKGESGADSYGKI